MSAPQYDPRRQRLALLLPEDKLVWLQHSLTYLK